MWVSRSSISTPSARKLRHDFFLEWMLIHVVLRHRALFPKSPLPIRLARYFGAGIVLALLGMLSLFLGPCVPLHAAIVSGSGNIIDGKASETLPGFSR